MKEDVRKKRITPLSEESALALIRKHYCVGDKIGNEARVVGFGRKYVPRGGVNFKFAGTYIDYDTVFIANSHGQSYFCAQDVARIPPGFHDMVHTLGPAGAREAWRQIEHVWFKVGNLPETPFWEGDQVCFVPNTSMGKYEGVPWVIDQIDYSKHHNKYLLKEAAEPKRFGAIALLEAEFAQLAFLERGNLWKMGHGERMTFASIEDEGKFYHSLGMSRKVCGIPGRPGEEGLFATAKTDEWEFLPAVRALQAGHAHQMKLKDKKQMTFVLIKYDNEDFGERMRAYELNRLW